MRLSCLGLALLLLLPPASLSAQEPAAPALCVFGQGPRGGAVPETWLGALPGALREAGLDLTVLPAVDPAWTLQECGRRLDREVLRHRPEAVLLCLGAAEARADAEGRPGHGPRRFGEDLQDLVARLQGTGALVFLLAAPREGPDPAPWAAAMRETARAEALPFLDLGRLDGAANRAAAVAALLGDAVREGALRARPLPPPSRPLSAGRRVLVEAGLPAEGVEALEPPRDGVLPVPTGSELRTPFRVDGDFVLRARLRLPAGSRLALVLNDGLLSLAPGAEVLRLSGPALGGGSRSLGPASPWLGEEATDALRLEAERRGGLLRVRLEGRPLLSLAFRDPVLVLGWKGEAGSPALLDWQVDGALRPRLPARPDGFSIPWVDLAGETERVIEVDREPGQYLGHPTLALLPDGKTLLCVYPKGHGRGPIVLKRSEDGGRTWSERQPVPVSWATSQETPTIHLVERPEGGHRLLLFSGLHPIRMARSEDLGRTWTELLPIGDYGGVVAMASLLPARDGSLLAWFHDDGRFLDGRGLVDRFRVYQVRSEDGGLHWSEPREILSHPLAQLCEPGVFRSPDGLRLAMLLRENRRRYQSFLSFSDDEGRSWSEPRELPAALTGDRHAGVQTPDGRLFLSFRDTGRESPTAGDWVAWVGTFEDLEQGREGRYRVRLMDNHHRWDCAYPGVALLPDGTIVAVTYGHWSPGEAPWIACLRLRLEELEARAAAAR